MRARRARPRLPARSPRRRARVRGDLRRVAGGRRLHRGLRRAGHRGALRRARAAGLVPAARCGRPRGRSGRCCRSIPHAIESLDLRGYDIVVSSSSAWAHGVLVDPGAVHVCYCHNPFRYAWNEREATLAARNLADPRPALRAAALALAPVGLDRRPARRHLRRELGDHRGADPALLRARGDGAAPAGGARALPPGPVGAHYLVLAELMAHKRIDVAVRAFNALRPAARGRGRRAGVAAAAAARGADRALHGPAVATTRSPTCCAPRRRWSSPRRRSSGSRPSRRSPPGGP